MTLIFEKNKDTKTALGIGIVKKLPEWMEDSGWDYKDYYDVWRWAMAEDKDFIFPYIVSLRGKKWHGETITIGMDDNNSLLWESVAGNSLPAVNAILEIPGLFSKEVLKMEYGTSPLEETFMRGDSKRHFRATNLGQYLALAMTQANGDFKLQDALKEYYEKEKCNSKEEKA